MKALETYKAITADLAGQFAQYVDASPKTIESYKTGLRQFINYLQAEGIQHPTRETVLSYRDKIRKDHSAATVNLYLASIRQFFAWTETAGLYPNIAGHIKGQKIARTFKKDALTPVQAKEILQTAQGNDLQSLRDYAIILLMVSCGLRDVELHRSNVEDLRPLGTETVLYIQGKGRDDKSEYVKIEPATEKAIRQYLSARGKVSGSDPLFTSNSKNSKGERLSLRSISGTVKAAMRKAGYDSDRLTAHSLRHTAVTFALLGGATLQQASQFARHSNIGTTQIYAHNLERAANPCEGIISGMLFN